jgi:hypothetical protein
MNIMNTSWSFLSKLSFLVPCLKNLEKSKCSEEETQKPSVVANFGWTKHVNMYKVKCFCG